MNKQDVNTIITKIREETSNLYDALQIIEVSHSSIKREKYCKKYNISYTDFMNIYNRVRNEIMMYPVVVNTMKAIIDQRNKTKKEHDTLYKMIIDILQEMIEKVKNQKNESELEKMKSYVKNE